MDHDPYARLPENNFEAFLHLEKHFRKDLDTYLEDNSEGSGQYFRFAQIYMAKLIGAAEELNIGVLDEYNIPSEDEPESYHVINNFLNDVESIRVRLNVKAARRTKRHSAALDQSQKVKIHKYINNIREEIDKSAVAASQKEKLYSILGMLTIEVDRIRTGLEAFGELAQGLAGISRDFENEGAQPWWRWFKAIMKVVDNAKEAEKQLPSPQEQKKLEPPRKEIPGPADTDDEIPF